MLEDLFRLDGKVVVITGATGLLGRKHAEAVACYGGTPILLDLSQQIIDDFASELNSKYKVGSVGFQIDITDEKAIESNVKLLMEKFGKKGNINTIKKMVFGGQNLKMAKPLWREIML